MVVARDLGQHFRELARLLDQVECSDVQGAPLESDRAADRFLELAKAAHGRGNKLIFIGNGGSAGIASHMAIDYAKNGQLRAMALNDAAALTCLGNDLGYENVFARQIDMLATPGDLLVAISSSGRSPNILAAVATARARGCGVVTFSGFAADNPLRCLGDINLYVACDRYGLVEVAHLALCHAVLDRYCPAGA